MSVVWWHDANGCHCEFDDGSVINQNCSQADCETCCKQKENELPGYVTDSGSGTVDVYGNPIPILKSVSTNINTSKIHRIYDDSNFRNIKASGETRNITIRGDEGAKFSITIKDSSDCSILKNKMEWVEIPKGGKYVFQQKYPSIVVNGSAVVTKETYTITFTASAEAGGIVGDRVLTQIADPVVTVTHTTSQTGPALVRSGGNITITGPANSSVEYNTPKIYTLTITEDGSSSEKVYANKISFNSSIVNSNVIKKVIDRCGDTGFASEISLKPLTTRTTGTIEGGITISGDLEVGMILHAKVEYTKVVRANLDEDRNILDYNKCKTHTDKFQLDNTHDLDVNMNISSDDIEVGTHILSIDCDKNITLSPKQIIRTDAVLTFRQEWWSTVMEVVSNVDSKGNAYIKLSNSIDIPDNTEVEFTDNNNDIQGVHHIFNSGSDSISLTSYINAVYFGDKNITYTLDLDKFITSKPNAYNQDVIVARNSKTFSINMIKHDYDLNASSKTGSVVGGPKNGFISDYVASTDSFLYTPNNGFIGEDPFTFTMSDGVKTSDEKTIRITVK